MSNYTVELKGLELLYYLMKDKDMTYKDAVECMKKHKQDMAFLKDLKINK